MPILVMWPRIASYNRRVRRGTIPSSPIRHGCHDDSVQTVICIPQPCDQWVATGQVAQHFTPITEQPGVKQGRLPVRRKCSARERFQDLLRRAPAVDVTAEDSLDDLLLPNPQTTETQSHLYGGGPTPILSSLAAPRFWCSQAFDFD